MSRWQRVAATVVVMGAMVLSATPGGLAALEPQSPPAAAVLTPGGGPVGTEVTLTITYDAGIVVWCTEEVEAAVSPQPGEQGWSVALLFENEAGDGFAIPQGWSRTAGVPALPMGPLPAGDTVTVTFTIPATFGPGIYTGVGGCVSPEGAQPGPGLADLVLEVGAPLAPAAMPGFTG